MANLTLSSGKYRTVPDYNTIKHALELIQNKKLQALFATMYACAARPTEILGGERYYNLHPKPVFNQDLGKYVEQEPIPHGSIVPALTYADISFDRIAQSIEFNLFVAKKKKKTFRNSIIYAETNPPKPSEKWLFSILFNYFFHKDEAGNVLRNGKPEEQLFVFPEYSEKSLRQNINYQFKKLIAKEIQQESGAHLLRHARITHKIVDFGFTLQDIHREIKWSNLDQALVYSHDDSDLKQKMKG
jgi:hypothetical protein